VGKSSLVNALVGGPRVVVSQVPGTTRDAVDTPLSVGERHYLLIDTAGIRRMGRVKRGLEKAAVFRSLRAVERAQVVAVVMDASEGVTDQDLNLAGQAVEAHRGLILVLNKWDLLADQPRRREQVLAQVERARRFAPWAPVLTTSALTGRGVDKLLPAAAEIYDQMGRRVETGPLNRALRELVEAHQPAVRRGRRLKLYYATQVGVHPPTVVIFANDPEQVHFSYRRYLVNGLRRFMGLSRSPLRLVLQARRRRPKGRRR
jgi:GTP-binding protein